MLVPAPRLGIWFLLTIAAPVPPQEALLGQRRADHAQLGALTNVWYELFQSLRKRKQGIHTSSIISTAMP